MVGPFCVNIGNICGADQCHLYEEIATCYNVDLVTSQLPFVCAWYSKCQGSYQLYVKLTLSPTFVINLIEGNCAQISEVIFPIICFASCVVTVVVENLNRVLYSCKNVYIVQQIIILFDNLCCSAWAMNTSIYLYTPSFFLIAVLFISEQQKELKSLPLQPWRSNCIQLETNANRKKLEHFNINAG